MESKEAVKPEKTPRRPLKIPDQSILTAFEHRWYGGTPSEEMQVDKLKPLAVIQGRDIGLVNKERRDQGEIAAVNLALYYENLDAWNEIPLVRLSEIDETGRAVDVKPELSGIYIPRTDQIIRDPKVLGQHPLTEDGRRKFVEAVLAQEQK